MRDGLKYLSISTEKGSGVMKMQKKLSERSIGNGFFRLASDRRKQGASRVRWVRQVQCNRQAFEKAAVNLKQGFKI